MANSAFPRVAGIFFGFIAVLQIYRAVMQIPIQFGTFAVPVAASWVAAALSGSLCVWGFRAKR